MGKDRTVAIVNRGDLLRAVEGMLDESDEVRETMGKVRNMAEQVCADDGEEVQLTVTDLAVSMVIGVLNDMAGVGDVVLVWSEDAATNAFGREGLELVLRKMGGLGEWMGGMLEEVMSEDQDEVSGVLGMLRKQGGEG